MSLEYIVHSALDPEQDETEFRPFGSQADVLARFCAIPGFTLDSSGVYHNNMPWVELSNMPWVELSYNDPHDQSGASNAKFRLIGDPVMQLDIQCESPTAFDYLVETHLFVVFQASPSFTFVATNSDPEANNSGHYTAGLVGMDAF